MEVCQSKTGGVCTQAATWKQSVHAGTGEAGRFLYFAYWCDEHAERIAQHRQQHWIAPAKMTQIVAETTEIQ